MNIYDILKTNNKNLVYMKLPLDCEHVLTISLIKRFNLIFYSSQ